MAAFEELGIMPEIISSLEDLGWELPTAIQTEAIPLILGGRDVCAAAPTGSGKTGAFALPILQIVVETVRESLLNKINSDDKNTSAPPIKLSADDRDPLIAIDPTGFICQSRDENAWFGCRATYGVISGNFGFECLIRDEGIARIGWSIFGSTYNLGTDRLGFGFGGTGKISNSGQFINYGESFGKGDTIGAWINLNRGEISFSKNSNYLGPAFKIPNNFKGAAFYPAFALKNAEIEVNFGQNQFVFSNRDHLPINQAKLSETSISGIQKEISEFQSGKPIAVILEPTKDLAKQTHECLSLFIKKVSRPYIRTELILGGVPIWEQQKSLKKGVEIVTGTAGRIIDLIEKGNLNLSSVRFFVLDEADELIQQSSDIITRIYDLIPKATQRLQVILFSATLHSPEIKKLTETITKFPVWIDLKGKISIPETVHHIIVPVSPSKNLNWQNYPLKSPTGSKVFYQTDDVHAKDSIQFRNGNLNFSSVEENSEAIKLLKPIILIETISKLKIDQALIFMRTKVECANLEKFLFEYSGGSRNTVNEFSCVSLHSDKSVQERAQNLELFKNGEVRFLICTDAAARGLDIKGLPYLINFTLPDDEKIYIHRVGRVGRMDRMGLAISLVATEKEKVWYHVGTKNSAQYWSTKLVSDGGSCLWWNEPLYLEKIEKLLNFKIPKLEKETNFSTVLKENIIYGEKRRKENQLRFQSHTKELKDSIRRLNNLESSAQLAYFSLKQKK